MRRIYIKKITGKFGIDLFVWAFATPLAYLLRLEDVLTQHLLAVIMISLLVLPIKGLIIYHEKFYLQSWHRLGIRDLISISRGVIVYVTIFLGIAIVFRYTLFIPLSVPFIEAMLLISGLGLLRLVTRFSYEFKDQLFEDFQSNTKRVLIAGAGDAGTMIAREMFRHPEEKMQPIGFLDDDITKKKQRFLGLKILGKTADVSKVIKDSNVDILLIAMPSESGKVVQRVVKAARGNDIEYKIIPAIHDLLSGEVTINQMRNVDLVDLLRRDPVQLNNNEIASYLNNKVILVTGAGGSIGSEIVRQITKFNPEKIILLDLSEFNLYRMEQEMLNSYPQTHFEAIITNVRDIHSLQSVFRKYNPHVLFHAAAYKHVPLMEENPEQAILNNVEGTKNLIDLALECNVKHFVNISTDKAVNPTSVMGASKRVAEYIVEWGSRHTNHNQIFASVRFGNVLGSSGSVVPKFKEQIRNHEAVTVTHPDMTRYFMTIPEATQLVLQAESLKQNGAVFVLDMGEPVKILDLANDLIRLSGLVPNVDIPIQITGVRPGEKLYEELLTSDESTAVTRHKKIFVAKQNCIPSNFEEQLEDLIYFAARNKQLEIKMILSAIIANNELGIPRKETG
jgi:FlaA1/EpsC-like NDP-sugar epimerase